MGPGWLDPSELRIGLGCMRLSTDDDRDERRGLATIVAALDAGITVLDTARAYGRDESEGGHNERLVARALRAAREAGSARVVTKGGMSRPGGAWVPDGRAKAIRADCEASLDALAGLPIDLYLLHAPDPRTPWRTSVRALARLVDEGLVRRVGVCNVNRRQLDEALSLAPVAAVQVALGPFDDRPLRGGVVERCEEAGIAMIAHSPLGGPRRAARLASRRGLAAAAGELGATPAEAALAWTLALSPVVVAIPGARRPVTARSAARAAALVLAPAPQATLDAAFARTRPSAATARRTGAEVLVVMGIPGAGKTRIAQQHVERGYERLNRDERGGSLRGLAAALDERLSAGAGRLVLDNTYLTRASRRDVLDTAARHGATVRCLWLDTPLAQAQVNLVERFLDRLGRLPTPEELRSLARREPGLLAPTAQMRALRELEPAGDDEGFASVEVVRFSREPPAGRAAGAVLVASSALDEHGWEAMLAKGDPTLAHLLFDWRPGADVNALDECAGRLSAVVSGPIETAICPHGGGPPICWCRPPLPGLPLEFTRRNAVETARSVLVGTSRAHRSLAETLGARFVGPGA
jgi:aryl-alcohol dehydrogenase-like predicted oxidoreductase